MDIDPPMTPERLRAWTHERQSGIQQVKDWKYWNVPPKAIDWLEECGCPQCKKCIPCIWARVSMDIHKVVWEPTRKMFDAPHYVIRGCNIHDRAEWIQYVLEETCQIKCRTLKEDLT